MFRTSNTQKKIICKSTISLSSSSLTFIFFIVTSFLSFLVLILPLSLTRSRFFIFPFFVVFNSLRRAQLILEAYVVRKMGSRDGIITITLKYFILSTHTRDQLMWGKIRVERNNFLPRYASLNFLQFERLFFLLLDILLTVKKYFLKLLEKKL